MAVFLGLNGADLEATQEEVVTTMLAAAAGQLPNYNSPTGCAIIW